MHDVINNAKWNQGVNYMAYRRLIESRLDRDRPTRPEQNSNLIQYSELNMHRMDRIEKTYHPSREVVEAFGFISDRFGLLVLSEGWCGDAAQILPVLHKATLNTDVDIRYLFRDEHLDLMDLHLTNGSRSIPKILFIELDGFNVNATWGPRPIPAQQLMVEYKRSTNGEMPDAQILKDIQFWYVRDKFRTIEQEFLEIIDGLMQG